MRCQYSHMVKPPVFDAFHIVGSGLWTFVGLVWYYRDYFDTKGMIFHLYPWTSGSKASSQLAALGPQRSSARENNRLGISPKTDKDSMCWPHVNPKLDGDFSPLSVDKWKWRLLNIMFLHRWEDFSGSEVSSRLTGYGPQWAALVLRE